MSKLQTNAIRHLSSASDNITLDNGGRVRFPNMPYALVSRNAGNIAGNSVVVFNIVDSDAYGVYNSSTGRFTAPVTGRYLITHGLFTDNAHPLWLFFRVNGVLTKSTYTSVSSYNSVAGSIVMNLNAGDYLDLYVNGSTYGAYGNDVTQCWATFTMIG
jgi:hypothetical protein